MANSGRFVFVCLLGAAAGLLAACADPGETQRRQAVQERELSLPIDLCIRHAGGETPDPGELVRAGFSPVGDNRYSKEFSDLDNALSAQGGVSVVLERDCTLLMPIHVLAISEYEDRVARQLAARGFKQVDVTGIGGGFTSGVAYSNGRATLVVSGFASRGVLGMGTNVTFQPLSISGG